MNDTHTQTLESFRRQWPKIGEQVCPELLDAILAVKQRRKLYGSPDSVFGLQSMFGILTLVLVVWYFTSPQSGIKSLAFQMFFWSIFIFGRRQRRVSGPFSLTRVLSEKDGLLAPDLWLTGLSYPQIAATEAAAAYARQLPFWKHLLGGLVSSGVLLGFCYYYGARNPLFLGICAVAIFLTTFLQRGIAPMFRAKQRLGDIYVACSLENRLYRPVFTGTVSAKGRWSLDARLHKSQIFLLLGFVAMGFVFAILFATARGGGAVSKLYLMPISFILMMMLFSLIWRFVIPAQVNALFENTTRDGQARFQQLVEKIAEREAA